MLGAGLHALSLLRNPHAERTLTLLKEAPRTVNELLDEISGASRGSMDRYAAQLTQSGAVVRKPRSGAKRGIDLELTDYGVHLADLALVTAEWLGARPGNPTGVEYHSDLAQQVLASRAEGWGGEILLACIERPRSMGWLESHLGTVPGAPEFGFESAASIRRRVRWLRDSGQLEEAKPGARPLTYRPTEWSYLSAGCLAFGIAIDLLHQPPLCVSPLQRTVALGLLQAGRLVRAEEDVEGVIQVVIRGEGPEGRGLAIHYEFEAGRLARWKWGKAENPRATGLASLFGWLGPLTGLHRKGPKVFGDVGFFNAVMAGVKRGLFAPNLAY